MVLIKIYMKAINKLKAYGKKLRQANMANQKLQVVCLTKKAS